MDPIQIKNGRIKDIKTFLKYYMKARVQKVPSNSIKMRI